MLKKPLLGKKEKKKEVKIQKPEISVETGIMRARAQLDNASAKYKKVIGLEVRNVRYCREKQTMPDHEEKSITKIKTAYYALNILSQAKLRLNDIETTEELYSAINATNEALRSMNNLAGQAERVKAKKFKREIRRMENSSDASEAIMKSMFDKREDFNDVVTDDVVERLIKGESIDRCVQSREGISGNVADIWGRDWTASDMPESELDFENLDLDEIFSER